MKGLKFYISIIIISCLAISFFILSELRTISLSIKEMKATEVHNHTWTVRVDPGANFHLKEIRDN